MAFNILARIRQKRKNKKQYQAYIQLNNLYLDIEAGRVKLTRRIYNRLMELLNKAEDYNTVGYKYWVKEFQKLPNWRNV